MCRLVFGAQYYINGDFWGVSTSHPRLYDRVNTVDPHRCGCVNLAGHQQTGRARETGSWQLFEASCKTNKKKEKNATLVDLGLESEKKPCSEPSQIGGDAATVDRFLSSWYGTQWGSASKLETPDVTARSRVGGGPAWLKLRHPGEKK